MSEAALIGRVAVLEHQNRELRRALKPFADAVYDDNGDITVHEAAPDYDDYVRAHFVYKRGPAGE